MEKSELSTKVLFLASLIDNRIAENDDDRQDAMAAEKRLKARLRAVLHQPTTATLSHEPSYKLNSCYSTTGAWTK